jgi:hypothetical protein
LQALAVGETAYLEDGVLRDSPPAELVIDSTDIPPSEVAHRIASLPAGQLPGR